MELKGKKINFLGDSITEGHGTSDWETKFGVAYTFCFISHGVSHLSI